MPDRLLITPQQLAEDLDAPDLVVLDASVHQAPAPDLSTLVASSARPDFEAAHIPGSRHLDSLDCLWDRSRGLRFALPMPQAAADAFAAHGVGLGRRVVVYDRAGGNWSARTFWTLRWLGFDRVRILDGGFGAWQAAGLPVTDAPAAPPPPSKLTARPRAALIATRAEVQAAIGQPGVVLVNALSAEQHEGRGGVRYHRPGRIPGSLNLPAAALQEEGRFVPAERVAALAEAAGIPRGARVIAYCGAGIAASALAFHLLRAGWQELSVYDGSLDEWSGDEALPMETGPMQAGPAAQPDV